MCCYVARVRNTPAQKSCKVGRPFMIRGVPVVAALNASDGWQAVVQPVLPADPVVREALAAEWACAGADEHASVASFARFVLQLLQLGAPPELVEGATQAMRDEVHHAQLCFGLASAYAGRPVGPGRLPVAGALEAVGVEGILFALIEEGCVGETLAAVEAGVVSERATDPAVQGVLRRIRHDESNHAELAWASAAWLCATRPELRATVRDSFDEILSAVARPAGGRSVPAEASSHGILCPSARDALRAQVVENLIRPCSRQLSMADPGAHSPLFRGSVA
jgi:hypothetical protein